MFKSEIRESTINTLIEKASARSYGHYLPKLVLKKVRGFTDELVSFDFPVTALIGPNGGGKTTILGAAGCAYKEVSPKRFFAKSGKYDESMQDWSIEYEIIDRDLNKKDVVRRTASFRNRRWNRDAPERPVLIFGVSRTVPANERAEFVRCASGSFEVPENRIEAISNAVCAAVSAILGKDIHGFKRLLVDEGGEVTLLTGRTKDGRGYSEFHFGAGESSVIRMVAEIELAAPETLVLIEEIENGLHPVATVRMVEYLIEAANRKQIQTILTTHSNDALLPLPSKAIWVATQDRIFQGKLDIQSLRAITGQINAQLVLFVEDKFAKVWLEAILRQTGGIAIDHLEVHAMQGDGIAVAINRYHNKDPSARVPSACIIDGDSRQTTSPPDRVFRFPGESPESYVFDKVMERWDSVGGRLSVALLQKFENSDEVRRICREVRMSNRDPHLLFSQIGERLGLLPEFTAASAFANIWAQSYGDDVGSILEGIRSMLPMETGVKAQNATPARG
jgi:predicted ATPase